MPKTRKLFVVVNIPGMGELMDHVVTSLTAAEKAREIHAAMNQGHPFRLDDPSGEGFVLQVTHPGMRVVVLTEAEYQRRMAKGRERQERAETRAKLGGGPMIVQ